MSAPSGFLAAGAAVERMEDDEDAALIDSFFLPGGILDPDDKEEDALMNVPTLSGPVYNRVPSNPWGNDSNDGAANADLLPSISDPSLSPVVTLPAAGDNANSTMLVRPPPGYSEIDRLSSGSDDLFRREATLFASACRTDEGTSVLDLLHSSEEKPTSGTSPETQLGSSHITPDIRPPCGSADAPKATKPKDQPQPNKKSPSADKAVRKSKQKKRSQNKRRTVIDTKRRPLKHEDEEQIVPLRISSPKPEGTCPLATMDYEAVTNEQEKVRQSQVVDKESNSKPTTISEKSHHSEDLVGGDEPSLELETPMDFPIEMLTVQHKDKRGSSTSSISTSSNETIEQDESQHSALTSSEDENCDDLEEVTDALNSGAAVIQEIPSAMKQATRLQKLEKRNKLEYSRAEKRTSSPEDPEATSAAEGVEKPATQQFSSMVSTLYSSMKEKATLSRATFQLGSGLQLQETIGLQLSKWRTKFHSATSLFAASREVMAALVTTSIYALTWVAYFGTKAIFVLGALKLQVYKYAYVELVEEPHVTTTYGVFYFTPTFCMLLMKWFLVPHWSPHLLSALAVWLLCRKIAPGPLSPENASMATLPFNLKRQNVRFPVEARPRDEQQCETILRILKVLLPLFVVAEGFSTEKSTLMGISGASRLTTAFMMCLVRKNQLTSPVGWVSWAMQVLVSVYAPSFIFLDIFVLAIGSSSIRLIRYEEIRRFYERKKTKKVF